MVISVILIAGSIRVGYFPDALPFAFMNQEEKMVGFDIEMAHILAREMNVKLELVLIDRNQDAWMLNNGYVDIIMLGIAVTIDKTNLMGFTTPYLNQTIAFVVKDYRPYRC